MNLFQKLNFKIFLKYYLIFISFSSIFLMSRIYQLEVNNSMAEWLINYQGGFGRRGFLGEFFFYISTYFDFSVRKVILFFLFFLFLTYYLSVYFYFKNLKFNFFFILSILSPLFIIFPLAELEALGRKDILIPIFFLVICNFYQRMNFYSLSIIFLFGYLILLLTHEIAIFYVPFFFIILLFKIKKIDLKKILILLLISLILLCIIYLLFKSALSADQIIDMCNKIKNQLSDKCGLGAYVLGRTLRENIAELGVEISHLIRAFFIFLFGYFALFFLIMKSNVNQNLSNILNKQNLKLNMIFIFLFLVTLIPFFIAVDWGRWFNLSYSMLLLFYFFCLKNNLISFTEIKFNFLIFKHKIFKTRFFLIITILILCFSWNPKAVYHEDIGSIPIYRVISKIYKYY